MTLGLAHACLGCGKPVKGTRCRRCQAAYDRQRDAQRGTTTQHGYGSTWQAISRAVLQRDGYVCRYCGGPAKTADHVIPKALGGTDHMTNLVAACLSCNSGKGARVLTLIFQQGFGDGRVVTRKCPSWKGKS